MARPLKQGVDYFPLNVALDDKFELIEAVHGLAGFGLVIKLYQKIYEHGYYLVVDEKTVLMLSKRVNVDINSINAVINDCVKWGIFDEKLYNDHTVLTSRGIQNRYFDIVHRRKEVHVNTDFLLVEHKLDEEKTNIVIVNINRVDDDNNPVNDSGKSRKGKGKGKGKESKSKKAASGYSKDYESWWFSYPKRNERRVGKNAAYTQYKKLNEEEKTQLVEATASYKGFLDNSGFQKPKDPERFLKNEFWKDFLKAGVNPNLKTREEVIEILKQAVSKPSESEMLDFLKAEDDELWKIARFTTPFLHEYKERNFDIIWREYKK